MMLDSKTRLMPSDTHLGEMLNQLHHVVSFWTEIYLEGVIASRASQNFDHTDSFRWLLLGASG